MYESRNHLVSTGTLFEVRAALELSRTSQATGLGPWAYQRTAWGWRGGSCAVRLCTCTATSTTVTAWYKPYTCTSSDRLPFMNIQLYESQSHCSDRCMFSHRTSLPAPFPAHGAPPHQALRGRPGAAVPTDSGISDQGQAKAHEQARNEVRILTRRPNALAITCGTHRIHVCTHACSDVRTHTTHDTTIPSPATVHEFRVPRMHHSSPFHIMRIPQPALIAQRHTLLLSSAGCPRVGTRPAS